MEKDREIIGIQGAFEALRGLSPEGRERAVRYVQDRLKAEPAPLLVESIEHLPNNRARATLEAPAGFTEFARLLIEGDIRELEITPDDGGEPVVFVRKPTPDGGPPNE